jgi:hypothetical protein
MQSGLEAFPQNMSSLLSASTYANVHTRCAASK